MIPRKIVFYFAFFVTTLIWQWYRTGNATEALVNAFFITLLFVIVMEMLKLKI